MPRPWLRLATLAALLATAQGRWKTGGATILARDDDDGKKKAHRTLEPLAPLVIKTGVCGGLTNQHVALVDGIMMGMLQGAQVLLPDLVPLDGTEGMAGTVPDMHPLSDLVDVGQLSREVDDIYTSYWCNRSQADPMRSALWCGRNYSAIVSSASAGEVHDSFLRLDGADPDVKTLSIPNMAMFTSAQADAYRQEVDSILPKAFEGHQRGLLDNNCTIFNLQVNESDAELWALWWRVSDSVNYVDSIKEAVESLLDIIDSHFPLAHQKALMRGFPALPEREPGVKHRFNFLHLRAEDDWVEHCEHWMSLADGVHRDNCINNTQNIAGVLVTEGLDPRVPLYIGTGLTTEQLQRMEIHGQYGKGFQGLTEAFTVVTKQTILEQLQPKSYSFDREQWAAVDLLLASAATEFVGNSVSTLSAYIIADRARRGQRAWHYNGGITPLQDMGALTPRASLSIPTFREPLKWVFTIHAGRSALSRSYVDMVKVAVLSAVKHTSLVPVCITTEYPHSRLSRWLVSHGVRVVNHWPTWASSVHWKAEHASGPERLTDLSLRTPAYNDSDAMVGMYLRIDIPILGMLDEFVLYTDVDVMFNSDINWNVLLTNLDTKAIRTRNDFARGLKAFSMPSTGGRSPSVRHLVTQELAALLPILSTELGAGVMVMNMRALRTMYDDFTAYITNAIDLAGVERLDHQGVGANVSFSSSPLSTPHDFLPPALDWKPYWEPNPSAKIIHFRGPKCERDIDPYMLQNQSGTEAFRPRLKACGETGDCASLCRKFHEYLDTAN